MNIDAGLRNRSLRVECRDIDDEKVCSFRSEHELRDALRGSVAFPFAEDLWAGNGCQNKDSDTGNFSPINDGSLVNCVPPEHLSPLGPSKYLFEVLDVTSDTTCNTDVPTEKDSIGDIIPNRRGDIGSLEVSKANMEVPVPLLDMVNESLETLVTKSAGTVVTDLLRDTPSGKVLNHKHVF